MAEETKLEVVKPKAEAKLNKKQEKELAERMKAEAEQLDKNIDAASASHNKRSLEIGYDGNQLKKKNLFGILGFESEDEYRLAKGIGRSTWFDNVGLAQAFDSVAKKVFITMKGVNAKMLAKIPKEHRFDEKLIEAAGTLTADKFEKLLHDKGFSMKSEEEPEHDASKVHEIPVALGIKMFKARRDALMVGLHKFMETHDITDESQALEMIVAEHSDGPTFASIFQQTVPKLKEALKEDGLSVEEAHARMKAALQDHVLAISDVIKRKGGYKELQKTA